MGLYSYSDGAPNQLVLDAGAVSSASTGDKELVIAADVPAGAYAWVALSDGAPSINFHDVLYDGRIGDLGQSAPTLSGAAVEGFQYIAATYGALPAEFGMPSYAAALIEPHIWLRK